MREFKLKKWVAAGLVIAMPFSGMADAAGLGRLNVLSQLGQPFSAEIDLVNVSKEELSTLTASLASPAAYQAANLNFNPALNALRLSIERRPNGVPYIKATSFRPVAEPFLDLLIEVTWQGGKIVREYSALLDPPGMEAPAAAVTAPLAVAPTPPTVQAAPPPTPPAAIETPAPQSSAPAGKVAPVPAAPPAVFARQYAVKQGDTLSGIAGGVKPEGVSLEQTLIGLFRANPDAFSSNNINQLRAGKILNIPEREQFAAIAQGEAAQEVRVHATNWNSYRQKVADVARAAPDAAPAAKGKIAARVEDKAAPAGPKDVVVLSKGDTGAAGVGKGKDAKAAADRVRALEEDLAARDKALAEAKERVAQLEKTLNNMKKLAEIKDPAIAAAQQAGKGPDPKVDAKVPPKPEAKAEPPKIEPPKVEPPKVEPPKPEPPKVEPPKVEPPKPEAKAPEVPKVEAPPPPKADPAVPKKPIVPPPPPEPSLMDTVMDNLVPIGGGIAALLVGIGAFWALRRRKKDAADDDTFAPRFKTEPFRGNVDAPAFAGAEAAVPEATVSNVTDVVDPIDEAQVYIDHGRDAQAEDILKEAIGKNPSREDIPLKLLEVYAARGDKNAFNSLARNFNKQTGGVGDHWNRAAAMGYALDPTNSLYPSTGEVVDLTPSHESSAGNIDLDIGGSESDPMGTTADILLDQGGAGEETDLNRTMVMPRDNAKTVVPEAVPGGLPDFNIELPPASAPAAPAAPASANMLEFNIDLPAASAPATSKVAPAPAAKADDGGLDFKVDFSGIDLDLDEKPSPAATPVAASGGVKDAHWEDVQQKFDLARAYQEMGDKEGAMEILHEVEREGDGEQKAEAQKMLQSLK